MDPEEVRSQLDELKRRLEAAGVHADIYVIGGSAMALNFPNDVSTRMTQDIDAVVSPKEEVRLIVDQMAEDLGLSPTWLNSFGAPFVPPRTNRRSSEGGVEVTIATTEELIAMKLAASREQDLHDLGILAQHAGVTDPERLVEIAFEAYGTDSMTLNLPREDYLIMATQALARKSK
ncbi:MAG TPA: DUF6036 family nucleotidyltransferase [Galbitalea sp.]|nr:DUF6036 family nucleotidyltransferase [Galbitalea sp.]